MPYRFIFALVAIAISFSLTGCGNESADDAESSSKPLVDQRFATLDSTLQYYNSIATRDPLDHAALLQICYGETDLHRRVLKVLPQMKAIVKLDREMFARFGEGWEPGRKTRLDAPDQPARLTKTESDRGEADYVNSLGQTRTVRFVKVGDRWWVSGYTFEYDPDMRQIHDEIDRMERVMPALAHAAGSISNYVQSRQINSAAEARRMFGLWIVDKYPELKADIEKVLGP